MANLISLAEVQEEGVSLGTKPVPRANTGLAIPPNFMLERLCTVALQVVSPAK
jgi:hypothetical protein